MTPTLHCEFSQDSVTRTATAACCPFCRSSQSSAAPRTPLGEPWRIVVCETCGQWYTTPLPEPEDWEQYYPPQYKPYQLSAKKSGSPGPLRQWLRRRKLRLHHHESAAAGLPGWLRTLVARVCRRRDPYSHLPQGQARLLDVGCGNGSYLAAMRDLGWQVTGLDKSRQAALRAAERFEVPVHVGCATNRQALPEGRFDLITAWQVLEHIESPRQALQNLRSLLQPQTGRLLLTAPNRQSLGASVFGADWIGWDLPRHVSHFNKESLCRMLTAEGLEVVLVRTIGQSGWLRHSARKCDPGILRRLLARKSVSRIASSWAVRHDAGESLFVVARVR